MAHKHKITYALRHFYVNMQTFTYAFQNITYIHATVIYNTRKFVLLIAAIATLFTPQATSGQDNAERLPNIIFILVDDMRWDELALTGHPFAKTPNLDRLGREGVTFHNAFVCTPLCSPSRASFLTGQYPHTHWIINNDRNGLSVISHKLVTFPQVLRKAGYETAFIGKWHMGDDDTRRPGFDHWISFRGQGLFIDPVVNVNGQRRQYTGYMTDLLNRWAEEFVDRKHDRPFLLYLSHKAVHKPYIPAERHMNLYSVQRYVPPKSADDDLKGKPSLTREFAPVDIKRIPGATVEPAEPRYGRGDSREGVFLDHLRCLSSVDEGVGMLLDALERTGQLDNTVIIFASDNGVLLGEHGLFMNKRVPYEESLRIPLLLRYPKLIRPCSEREQLVLNIDIAPTLYELAGVTPPIKMHGKSLVPVLLNPEAEHRTDFLAEYFFEKVAPRHAEWQAVRSDRWKYIHYVDLEGMDELYDLKDDPYELNNLISFPDHATTVRTMKERLTQLLSASDAD
jgi:arylsulfatase A-like enzyme